MIDPMTDGPSGVLQPIAPRNPLIILCAPAHADVLEPQFARYALDYDVRTTHSCAETLALLRSLAHDDQVALVVAETEVPDAHVLMAFHRWRSLVPRARRIIAAHSDHFRERAEELRPGLATGKYDAYLLMPRGVRDEEFHTTVTELLSDWGSTAPVVASMQIVSPRLDALTSALRDFAFQMGMPAEVVTPDSEIGREIIARHGDGTRFPIVSALNNLTAQPSSVRDLAVTIYGSSEGLRTVVLESDAVGGQAGTSSMIRNYLGFPRGISGMRLSQRARNQAIRFGTRFYTGWPVEHVVLGEPGEPHRVLTGGGEVHTRAVVIATGVAYRRLGIDRVEELVGLGVHYGAAVSAAPEMEDRDVFVVGGGNSAGQAALHLAKYARSVTILIRRPEIAQTMSDYLIREMQYVPSISIRPCSQVVDGGGEGRLEWIDIRDLNTEEVTRAQAGGLFLLLGAEPKCDWVPSGICPHDNGFVLTGRDVPKEFWHEGLPPANLATSVPGLFAAGDIRAGSMKRVAAASGEGASVVPLVHAHLAASPGPAN
ncbi:MAG: thioredoxin reductase [Marmoricola sp.]|nr:thioredoxin reductase [Marmoricola sp.]